MDTSVSHTCRCLLDTLRLPELIPAKLSIRFIRKVKTAGCKHRAKHAAIWCPEEFLKKKKKLAAQSSCTLRSDQKKVQIARGIFFPNLFWITEFLSVSFLFVIRLCCY